MPEIINKVILPEEKAPDVIAVAIVNPHDGSRIPQDILIPVNSQKLVDWQKNIAHAIKEKYDVTINVPKDILTLQYSISSVSAADNAVELKDDNQLVEYKKFTEKTQISMKLPIHVIKQIQSYNPKIDFAAIEKADAAVAVQPYKVKLNIIDAKTMQTALQIDIPANSDKFSNWQKNIINAVEKEYKVKLDTKDVSVLKYRVHGLTDTTGVEIKDDSRPIKYGLFYRNTFISMRLSPDKISLFERPVRPLISNPFDLGAEAADWVSLDQLDQVAFISRVPRGQ